MLFSLQLQETHDSAAKEYPLTGKTLFSIGRLNSKKATAVKDIRLGKFKLNDLVLDHPKISRFQCFLYFREETWFMQDGDCNSASWQSSRWSANGTFLNGEYIKERVSVLRHGDIITFASIPYPRVVFLSEQPPAIESYYEDSPTIEHEYEN